MGLQHADGRPGRPDGEEPLTPGAEPSATPRPAAGRDVGRRKRAGLPAVERTALRAVLLVFLVAGAALLVRQAFTIDEFQYAHASWLVASGSVPYRDFAEHHFPLFYQTGAAVFLALGDDPTGILALRLWLLPWIIGALVFAPSLAGSSPRARRWVPVLLLACPAWLVFATQVRPELFMTTLCLGSFSILCRRGGRSARGDFAAGAALALAVWSNQKALLFLAPAAPLLAAWLVRPPTDGRGIRHRGAFVAGGASVIGLALVWVLSTGSASAFVYWTFTFVRLHERLYPGAPLLYGLERVLTQSGWLLALTLLGAGLSFRRSVRARPARLRRELPLLTLAIGGWVCYAAQASHFPYNLLPFLTTACVYASRGAAAAWTLLARLDRRRWYQPAAAVLGLVLLAAAAVDLGTELHPGNARQLASLRLIGRQTAPGEPVYDNTGCAVARPHVVFHFCTSTLTRQLLRDWLETEVPRSILRTGCVSRIPDQRSRGLSPRLDAFLRAHFFPFSDDLHLWGTEYDARSGPLAGEFLAPRGGTYLVDPPQLLESGSLTIDGSPAASAFIPLRAGSHSVEYEGPPAVFRILWVPRDGRAWTPVAGARPSLGQFAF